MFVILTYSPCFIVLAYVFPLSLVLLTAVSLDNGLLYLFFFKYLTAFLKKLNMPDIGGRATETEVNSVYAYKWVLLFFC